MARHIHEIPVLQRLHRFHAPRWNASTDALRQTVCLREKVYGEKLNTERRRQHSHGDRGNGNQDTQSTAPVVCIVKQYNLTRNSLMLKTL